MDNQNHVTAKPFKGFFGPDADINDAKCPSISGIITRVIIGKSVENSKGPKDVKSIDTKYDYGSFPLTTGCHDVQKR